MLVVAAGEHQGTLIWPVPFSGLQGGIFFLGIVVFEKPELVQGRPQAQGLNPVSVVYQLCDLEPQFYHL